MMAVVLAVIVGTGLPSVPTTTSTEHGFVALSQKNGSVVLAPFCALNGCAEGPGGLDCTSKATFALPLLGATTSVEGRLSGPKTLSLEHAGGYETGAGFAQYFRYATLPAGKFSRLTCTASPSAR